MTPNEFEVWLTERTPALEAWGGFVTAKISERVCDGIGEKRYKTFFKIPPGFRVKDAKSAKEKLTRKGYLDPTEQMTDLVGARFVVLLRTDIRIVEDAITAFPMWAVSRERDFEFEISSDPEVFDYQSVHFLLTCTTDEQIGDVVVPGGTTCEVQVRTLLQHAYAEVVHDNVYKPGGVVPPLTRRVIARSMAFVESADELFCEALEQLASVNTKREEWLNFLIPLYFAISGRDDASQADREDTLAVIDTYRDFLVEADRTDVERIVRVPAVAAMIRRRSAQEGLFSRPICILAYWLAQTSPRALIDSWPFGSQDADVRQVLADLGIAAR